MGFPNSTSVRWRGCWPGIRSGNAPPKRQLGRSNGSLIAMVFVLGVKPGSLERIRRWDGLYDNGKQQRRKINKFKKRVLLACDSSLEFMFGPGRAVRARWSGVVICFAHQQPRAETQPAGRGGWPGSNVAGSASAGAANVRLGSWAKRVTALRNGDQEPQTIE